MSIKTIIEHNGVEYTAHVATIKSTHLGGQDHGIFTASLGLRWDNSGISVGGMTLDTPDKDADGKFLGRVGSAYGLDHIMRILETVGAGRWENLPGERVFVLFENGGGWGSTAKGIANVDTGAVLIFKEHAAKWLERKSSE